MTIYFFPFVLSYYKRGHNTGQYLDNNIQPIPSSLLTPQPSSTAPSVCSDTTVLAVRGHVCAITINTQHQPSKLGHPTSGKMLEKKKSRESQQQWLLLAVFGFGVFLVAMGASDAGQANPFSLIRGSRDIELATVEDRNSTIEIGHILPTMQESPLSSTNSETEAKPTDVAVVRDEEATTATVKSTTIPIQPQEPVTCQSVAGTNPRIPGVSIRGHSLSKSFTYYSDNWGNVLSPYWAARIYAELGGYEYTGRPIGPADGWMYHLPTSADAKSVRAGVLDKFCRCTMSYEFYHACNYGW